MSTFHYALLHIEPPAACEGMAINPARGKTASNACLENNVIMENDLSMLAQFGTLLSQPSKPSTRTHSSQCRETATAR